MIIVGLDWLLGSCWISQGNFLSHLVLKRRRTHNIFRYKNNGFITEFLHHFEIVKYKKHSVRMKRPWSNLLRSNGIWEPIFLLVFFLSFSLRCLKFNFAKFNFSFPKHLSLTVLQMAVQMVNHSNKKNSNAYCLLLSISLPVHNLLVRYKQLALSNWT